MRNPVSAYRFLGHAAILTVLTVTIAGCSESSRFGQPLFTGSTANQEQIIGGQQQMPAAVASAPVAQPVTQSYLPPPGASDNSSFSTSSASPSAALPPGSYQWTPQGVKPVGTSNVAAYAPPTEPLTSSGRHTVVAGDTLYSIGRRYGVSPADIANMNGLDSVAHIRIGQQLQIPGGASGIPSSAVAAAPAPQTGEPVAVASAAPQAGVLGQLKSEAPVAEVPSVSAQTEPRVAPGVPSVPSVPVETKAPPSMQTPPASTASLQEELEPASADGTSFRWPVRGRIISGFGSKPNGERNDGINLAVPEGTAVKAAEAGTVIYAGNELEGYGKLVLIRHADDWVSAYAHNSDLKVQKGDTVRRGQTVATAGMSGSVSSPQVHFELRQKAKPVNPLDYLAAGA